MIGLNNFSTALVLFTVLITLSFDFTQALRDVRVKIPHVVRRGEKAILRCLYDIEDDSLYSVKWYKGRREFYRYTPKENPPMKIFQFPGVKIKRFASNESQVVLDAVTMASTGKYSCEVSADAPSFHTLIGASELEVVEIPHNAPVITGVRQRYRIGDILRGNCTSRHSKPAANLTWTVNYKEVNPVLVRHHRILRDVRNDMETSVIGIHFVLDEEHFDNGKLKLRCTAEISDIYHKTVEKTIIEMDHFHRYASSINMIQPDEHHDPHALHDGEMLPKKTSYLTQIQDFLFNLGQSSEEEEDIDFDMPSKAAKATINFGILTPHVMALICLSYLMNFQQLARAVDSLTSTSLRRLQSVTVAVGHLTNDCLSRHLPQVEPLQIHRKQLKQSQQMPQET